MRKWRRMAVTGAVAFMTALLAVVLIPNSASAHGAHDAARQPYLPVLEGRPHRDRRDRCRTTRPARRPSPQSGANSAVQLVRRAALRRRRPHQRVHPRRAAVQRRQRRDYTGFDLPSARLAGDPPDLRGEHRLPLQQVGRAPRLVLLYVTKDGWDPTKPLDLGRPGDAARSSRPTNPPSVGPPGTVDGYYYWNGHPARRARPAGTSSTRSGSAPTAHETFYGCSDVVFDGGNGEVTGVGRGGTSTPTRPRRRPSPRPDPDPDRHPTPTPTPTSGGGGCTATYRTISSWSGGFQAEVTVSNPGSSSINGWTAKWALGSGTPSTACGTAPSPRREPTSPPRTPTGTGP